MERKDIMTIGDVLRQCLENSRMQDRIDEVRACDNFSIVVGEHLASLCQRPAMRKGRMTIVTPNASLRSDFNMKRGLIARRINELLGKEIVKELIFR